MYFASLIAHSRSLQWLVPAFLLATAVAVLVALDLSPSPAYSDASISMQARALRPTDSPAPGCDETASGPNVVFDLGDSAATLTRQDESELCASSPDGTLTGVKYASVVYGTCTVDDCAPPLEIQTWPSCARSAASYDAVAPDGTDLDPAATFAAAGAVPSASFEGGTRQEVYLPAVTVVIFATNASLARSAADAVASAAATSGVNATGDTAPPVPAACKTSAAAATNAANTPAASTPLVTLDAQSQNLDAAVAADDPAPAPDPTGAGDDATTTAGSTP
jgi:hypothetical protein